MSRAVWRGAVVALVVAVVAAGAWLLLAGEDRKHVTAYFERTPGLYESNQVRVLGVPVGEITEITPAGEKVRVEMAYDADRKIPADARAAIVAPSLVSGRYVQLAPVYTGGPVLADGATIPLSRTAEPVEWDEIKKQLNRLATALGPRGANEDGSVARALAVLADNLEGQGDNVRRTIESLSALTDTLNSGRGDLFATLRNLQEITAVLASSDRLVERFGQQLASVSDLLENNRAELSAALEALNVTVREVSGFVQSNRDELTESIDELAKVTKVLVEEKKALTQLLHVAPTALTNFYHIYNPLTNSLTAQLAVSNLQSPAIIACSTLFAVGAPPEQCNEALAPFLRLLETDAPPVRVDPLQREGVANQTAASGSGPGLNGLMLPGGAG